MNLKINKEIKQILKEKGISLNDGIPILLGVYFKYRPEYFPKDLVRRVFSCRIFTMEYGEESSDIKWVVPLFEGQAVNTFDWIKEYMDMFSAVNTSRRGARSYVEKYMRDLFKEHPDIRKEDVINATKKYISELNSSEYIMKSHKFIKNNQGTPLLDYIQEMRETNQKLVDNPFKRII